MLGEEFLHDGCPDRDRVGIVDEEMSLLPKRRKQVIFSRSSGGPPSGCHSFRQSRTKERIVLEIDPECRDSCGAAEFLRSFDQVIRLAIVVRFAFETTAATAPQNRLQRAPSAD